MSKHDIVWIGSCLTIEQTVSHNCIVEWKSMPEKELNEMKNYFLQSFPPSNTVLCRKLLNRIISLLYELQNSHRVMRDGCIWLMSQRDTGGMGWHASQSIQVMRKLVKIVITLLPHKLTADQIW